MSLAPPVGGPEEALPGPTVDLHRRKNLQLWVQASACRSCVVPRQNLEAEKERKSECLPSEPAASDPESVKIVFKMPNDTRVERRFLFGQSLTVSDGCW